MSGSDWDGVMNEKTFLYSARAEKRIGNRRHSEIRIDWSLKILPSCELTDVSISSKTLLEY